MNRLKQEKQELVLNLLQEGNTIRGIQRLTGVHQETIIRLIRKVGENCAYYMAEKMRNLDLESIEMDEIWTYNKKKQKQLTDQERHNEELGDQYVFIALDRQTKLIPCFAVGKRNSLTTYFFLRNLKSCLNGNKVQITTDQFPAYKDMIPSVFGDKVSYAQLRKVYYGDGSGREGYSPAALRGVKIRIVIGEPSRDKISTSYIERQNLTIRTQMRRFTRLTNAASKKLDCLKAALSIHFFHYNFMRLHQTLKCTPAMEAGICNTFANWSEVLN